MANRWGKDDPGLIDLLRLYHIGDLVVRAAWEGVEPLGSLLDWLEQEEAAPLIEGCLDPNAVRRMIRDVSAMHEQLAEALKLANEDTPPK